MCTAALVTGSASATCPLQTTARLVVTQNCPVNAASPGGTLTSASIDFPQDVRTMFNDVFEEMPWHLKEQQQAMVDELEAKRRWPS